MFVAELSADDHVPRSVNALQSSKAPDVMV
jgi:hypothetical protein